MLVPVQSDGMAGHYTPKPLAASEFQDIEELQNPLAWQAVAQAEMKANKRRRGRRTQATTQKAVASKLLASTTLDALGAQVDY